MNTAATIRLTLYLVVGLALGAFMTVWGIIHGDAALVASGLGLVTIGGTAAPNVTSRTGDHGTG